MKLHYHLPRPDLRDYVRAYYYFETDQPTAQPMSAELGNIRCLLAGGGQLVMPDGGVERFAPTVLIGPTMGAYRLEAEAGTRAFGVSILPRGWKILLGVNAAEVTDKVVDLTALAGKAARLTGDEIRSAGSLPEMADAADRFFRHLLTTRAARGFPYPGVFEQWLLNPDDLDLDQLVAMMDVSRRQTDRIAKQFFGASPKLLQRKYRALRAADRILAGQSNWLDAAGPGFYDQSHFIKEFKTFIGVTPGEFAADRSGLAASVQTKRRREVVRHAQPFL